MSDSMMWFSLLAGLILVHRLASSMQKKIDRRIDDAPVMMLKKMKYITSNRLFDGVNSDVVAVKSTTVEKKEHLRSFECLCKTKKDSWFIYTFKYNARSDRGFSEEVTAINDIGAKRFLATDIETYKSLFGEPVQA